MTASLEDLSARLATLEAVSAIKELKAQYWRSVDRQRPDDVRECFVSVGAVIDMEGVAPCADREEFVTVIKTQGCRPDFYSLHSGQNPIIRLTAPDRAEGVWDAFFTGIDVGQRLVIQLTGEYNDVYVRQDGRWLIQVQKFRQTSLLIQAIGDGGAPQVVTFGMPDAKAFDR